MTDTILFFDAKGKEIGKVARSTHKRFSQRAAADQRKMDEFRRTNPKAVKATIGDLVFTFDAKGRSQVNIKF